MIDSFRQSPRRWPPRTMRQSDFCQQAFVSSTTSLRIFPSAVRIWVLHVSAQVCASELESHSASLSQYEEQNDELASAEADADVEDADELSFLSSSEEALDEQPIVVRVEMETKTNATRP